MKILDVGDAAELTLTRSSQGHIHLEMRTKLGAIKVRVTESNYAALMFGQAHVSAEVVRHIRPQTVNEETGWVIISESCDDCGADLATRLLDHEPTEREKAECKQLLGGMSCISARVVKLEMNAQAVITKHRP